MKNITFGLGFILLSAFASAQGLERIVLEKYYISNAADAAQALAESAGPGDTLPAGSVTYRIYADMLPGYKLLSLNADKANGHWLKFRTTTSFYNNPSGGYTPSSNKTAIKNKLLALDSWFSLGSVATGQYGILKTDDDGAANNITVAANPAGVLLNNVGAMGIPLTTQDGMIAGTGVQTPAFAGFTNEFDVFGDGSVQGNSLILEDGAVYSSIGVVGQNPDTNRVLLAQLTTDGSLSYELNILILNIASGKGQFYVANNPKNDPITGAPELSIPSLTYPGTVDINNQNPATESLSPSELFNVYPNPTKDALNIEIRNTKQNGDNSYTLYNVLGGAIIHKDLKNISGTHKENIDISYLEKGFYFIQVTVDGVASTKRVIKN